MNDQEMTVSEEKKSIELDDIPNLTVEGAAKYCIEELGIPGVTARAVKSAIYSRRLKRHLITNRVFLSRSNIVKWVTETDGEAFIDRVNE